MVGFFVKAIFALLGSKGKGLSSAFNLVPFTFSRLLQEVYCFYNVAIAKPKEGKCFFRNLYEKTLRPSAFKIDKIVKLYLDILVIQLSLISSLLDSLPDKLWVRATRKDEWLVDEQWQFYQHKLNEVYTIKTMLQQIVKMLAG